MNQLIGGTLLCAWVLFPAFKALAHPLGHTSVIASYVLSGDGMDRPDHERDLGLTVVAARIMLGPVLPGVGEGPDFQWYGLEWERRNGELYQMWVLLDGWPTEEDRPEVAEYLWQEPGWESPVAFRHESTGRPLLPRNDLWTHGWPQDADACEAGSCAPSTGTPDRIVLQGWEFRRVGLREADDLSAPTTWDEVPLNPDLLIGWISMDRDRHGRPFYRLPSGLQDRYEYVHKSPEDIEAHYEAGANFLVSHPRPDALPEWIHRRGVYHSNLGYKMGDWPADLYRPNFWGTSNHIDEPAVHNWGLQPRNEENDPLPELQAVDSLQRIVRRQSAERGRESINERIGRPFGLGRLTLVEYDYVSWEYEWATAWYQLAVEEGVAGIVDEDATSNDLVESYNMAFGTQIPPTIENATAIRVAVLRGAARNFDKKWGVGFYHPNEVKLKSSTIPLFYDRGATYFWFWTGWVGITDNSGLPYSYQRYYASLVRQAAAMNPDRDMDSLLRAAKVAVCIPYGYTFAPHSMHRLPWLHLERPNQHGVTYRRVLSNAAQEVERLLRLGIDFDVVVDDPLFHKTGYEEIVYAQADGLVRIERSGREPVILPMPRPIQRPDLGPGPTLFIEIDEALQDDPGNIILRAVGRLGTGDWAGESPHARVSWEIYHPDGRVTPTIFPEFGSSRTLKVGNAEIGGIRHPVPEGFLQEEDPAPLRGGSYLVRAALADIFGRPAIAYREVVAGEIAE